MGKTRLKVDTRHIKKYRDGLQRFHNQESKKMMDDCVQTLADDLLKNVSSKTPVSSKAGTGGTLKRGWAIRRSSTGKHLAVVYNNVDYASFVEYGHRTRGGTKFVPGVFMLRRAVSQVGQVSGKIVRQKFDNKLYKVVVK